MYICMRGCDILGEKAAACLESAQERWAGDNTHMLAGYSAAAADRACAQKHGDLATGWAYL